MAEYVREMVRQHPGRPKKGATPPQPVVDVHHGMARDDIPAGISIPISSRSEDG